MDIPANLLPHDTQVPKGLTPEQTERFRLCFAITRLVCQRDDPVFTAELYSSDMPTDSLRNQTDTGA